MKAIEVAFPEPCAEAWEDMTPAGCNRHCATCDKVIHDLEQMTGDQLAELLDESDDVCVRAKVDTDGNVRLKDRSNHGMPTFRRVATGAAASLGVAACSGMGSDGSTAFNVSGAITGNESYGLLELQRSGEAIDRKPGPRPRGIERRPHPVYAARPDANGEYNFQGVGRGKYTLSWTNCYGRAVLAEIEIDKNDLQLANLTPPPEIDDQYCEIIVGVMVRPQTGSRRP
jgi:hypothetical protein